MSSVLPFSAVVGQDRLKLALILNAIYPRCGGVLVRGEPGTAKSTLARAFAELLPPIRVFRDSPYNDDPDESRSWSDWVAGQGDPNTIEVTTRTVPFVQLPVNASEDRVSGSLDIHSALKQGDIFFQPGLMAAANRGILYIDEVNLLDGNIVDILLDAAASGRHRVERESISINYPSQFLLIGTMNPEEGSLRPQFLDRFGMLVTVEGLRDSALRAQVTLRNAQFDSDREAFNRIWGPEDARLRERIERARSILPAVAFTRRDLILIGRLVMGYNVAGHRADNIILAGARAHAAWQGRDQITREDIQIAAEYALPHRLPTRVEARAAHARGIGEELGLLFQLGPEDLGLSEEEAADLEAADGLLTLTPDETGADVDLPEPDPTRPSSGRRGGKRGASDTGRYVSARTAGRGDTDIALDATLRAAAGRGAGEGRALPIAPDDLRAKVRSGAAASSVLFLLDTSDTLVRDERIGATISALFSLLKASQQRRDRVALLVFHNNEVREILPFTNSIELATEHVKAGAVPAGGNTPLVPALKRGYEMLQVETRAHPDSQPLLVLLSDCEGNVSLEGRSSEEEALEWAHLIRLHQVRSLIVNLTAFAEMDYGRPKRLAEALDAELVDATTLKGGGLSEKLLVG